MKRHFKFRWATPGQRTAMILFLLAPISFLMGCEASTPPTPSRGAISGKAYYVGSLSPLAGVEITCAGQATTTGPDGLYIFADIPEGKQIISARATNCLPYSDTISVLGNTKRYIFMSFAPARLSGTVINVIDGPIVGAKVTLNGLFVYTDTAGRYDLRDVSIGTDTLIVLHPDYFAYKTVVTLAALEQKSDIVLKRERVFQGGVTEDTYVDARFPDYTSASSQTLALTAAGSGGRFPTGDNIYLKLSFPSYMADARVSILDARLELNMNSAAPVGCFYQTFEVDSAWSSDRITYNTQPPHGTRLDIGNIGDGSTGKYWPFLRLTGVNTLISELRAGKPLYGIVIIGGLTDMSSTSFRSLEAMVNMPRLTITVRY